MCVFALNDTSRFSISSVWLLSHYIKSSLVPQRENCRTKMEEVDMLYGIVPGKSNALLFFFIYTVNRIAHQAISNIWNEQHIAVSVISLNTYWFQDLHGWIIDLTSEKKQYYSQYTCYSQSFFTFYAVSQLFFFIWNRWRVKTGTMSGNTLNYHAMNKNMTHIPSVIFLLKY